MKTVIFDEALFFSKTIGIHIPTTVSAPFITTAKHVVVVETIKYLTKYMTICLILACEKAALYM